MKNIKNNFERYELTYYIGSLDFPCDFCNSNSYRNFHIKMGSRLAVVCEECLNKEKLQQSSDNQHKQGEE